MKHVFIVNPVSGKTDAGKSMVPKIEKVAQAAGVDYEIVYTNAPKHAVELATFYAKADESSPVRLYAVGGDGTLNEVLTGAYPYKNAEVAAVPVGSGNDFVRNFGSAEDFLDIDKQLQGTAVEIDLMEVDDGICAAITSAGLDAEVAYNIPKYRRIPLLGGSMAYNISIVERLLKPMGKNMRVTIDGKVSEGKYLIATVCNGQSYGGGYMAAPVASMEDGILDVILVRKVSRLKIAGIIGKYKKGQHFEDGKLVDQFKDVMEYHKGREVVIEPTDVDSFIINVDGECGPAPRVYAKVMPLAGRFVLPSQLAAARAQRG